MPPAGKIGLFKDAVLFITLIKQVFQESTDNLTKHKLIDMKATARQEEILKRHLPDYWKGQIDTNNPLITSIIKAMNEVERTPEVVERTVYRYKAVSLPTVDQVAAASWKSVSSFRNANDNVHHMLGFLEGGKWVITELKEILNEEIQRI